MTLNMIAMNCRFSAVGYCTQLENRINTHTPLKQGYRNNKNKMKKNTNTTLELPEGSKATIQGKVIDGKYYLVVEVENEEQELKEGDITNKKMDVV